MNASWPAPLKEWVQRSLGEATDANKAEVHAELKKVIYDAFQRQAINTTDWSKVELSTLKTQRLRTQAMMTASAASPVGGALGKRKKSDGSSSKGIVTPATYGLSFAKLAAEEEANEKRKKRFAREHQIEMAKTGGGSSLTFVPPGLGGMSNLSLGTMSKASKRRLAATAGLPPPEPLFDPNVIDWDKHTIVGTSQVLEKKYLRLTTEPDPSTIRPLPVLRQTLELLKKKWKKELNYAYICDQFKSMRQDLTVQRIKNEFTVSVYEIHARIALESKDLGELNQCQSMLRQLYTHNLGGHPDEFLAYRILYMLHTKNRSELNLLLTQLTPQQTSPPCVQHALKVQQALANSNYHAFFLLFLSAPNMGGYMMDHFVDRERVAALATMSKAYQTLPFTFVATELGFENSSDAIDFLIGLKLNKFIDSTGSEPVWQCKPSAPYLAEEAKKHTKVDIKGQL